MREFLLKVQDWQAWAFVLCLLLGQCGCVQEGQDFSILLGCFLS